MTITATFSNGFTDAYKGDRDVKAAWAIINKATGAVIKSGHSLDAAKAARTASGNLREVSLAYDLGLPDHPLRYIAGPNPHLSAARRRADRAHNAARLALIASLTTIEVVAL